MQQLHENSFKTSIFYEKQKYFNFINEYNKESRDTTSILFINPLEIIEEVIQEETFFLRSFSNDFIGLIYR